MSESMTHSRTFEVLTAEPVRQRRKLRQWSEAQKAQMVEEALVPGAKVSEIARTHGVDPSQLFGWRRKAMASGQIRPLDEGGGGERFTRFEAVRTDLVDICVGDATVRVNAAIDPELLSRILKVVRRS